jgi:hypothetical protein
MAEEDGDEEEESGEPSPFGFEQAACANRERASDSKTYSSEKTTSN